MQVSGYVKKGAPIAVLAVLLVFTYLIYFPGLSGGFLFDDYPNLEPLGEFGGVVDWARAKSFIFSGIAGPLGRPISLASFLLDDNTWPSQGAFFKVTNLKIHLLCGLFLIWSTYLLMRLLKRSENNAAWVALISGGIWLVHPYMVSTTLYVIQRMAQISTLFIFFGTVLYLKGRIWIVEGNHHGYWIMSFSIPVFSLLAVFSKENGVLLPVLLIVFESVISQHHYRLNKLWLMACLWLPTAVVIGYLVSRLNLSNEPMPSRLFTQWQRIITEPRILTEYLYHLYVPHIEGRGLFQDGYKFSTSILNPLSTLFSLLLILILIFIPLLFRRTHPLLFIAFFYFFVGHLLESTWLNLELYFEHRNYLSAAFLFLPIAQWFVDLQKRVRPFVVVICLGLLFCFLGFFTLKRSELWSNSNKLELYWAATTPDSARAQNRIGTLLLEMGKIDESIKFLDEQNKKFSNSSLLTINLLLVKVYVEKATKNDFKETARQMERQPFDAQAVKGLRSLVEKIISRKTGKSNQYVDYSIDLLNAVGKNPAYAKYPLFQRLSCYLDAKLYLSIKNYELAYEYFSKAMALYGETDAALSMVAEMGNDARPVEALKLWDQAYEIYKAQPDRTLIRSRSEYDFEFKRIKEIMLLAKDQLEMQQGK